MIGTPSEGAFGPGPSSEAPTSRGSAGTSSSAERAVTGLMDGLARSVKASRSCSFCGPRPHPNVRCAGTSDEGRYPCACSFPNADNYSEVAVLAPRRRMRYTRALIREATGGRMREKNYPRRPIRYGIHCRTCKGLGYVWGGDDVADCHVCDAMWRKIGCL